jgi:hypothetical protein
MTREEIMSSEYDEKNRNPKSEPGQTDRDKNLGGRESNPQGQQTEREGEQEVWREGQGRRSSETGSSEPSGRSGGSGESGGNETE